MSDTKSNILNSSAYLLYNNSFDRTTIKEITAGIGIQTSTFHYYFPSKNDLGKHFATLFFKNFAKESRAYVDATLKSDSLKKVIIGTQSYFYKLVFSDTKLLRLINELLALDNVNVLELTDIFDGLNTMLSTRSASTILRANLTQKMYLILVDMYIKQQVDIYTAIELSSDFYLKMVFNQVDVDLSEDKMLIHELADSISFDDIDPVKTFLL